MKKILIKTAVISLIGFATLKSSATFFFPIGPVQDYLRMAKEQLKTLDDQIVFSEKMEQAYAALEQMGVLSSQEVDAKNAAWGNQNVREARRVQEISRLEQMQKSVPAFMPCGTITNNILMKHVSTNKKRYLEKQNEFHNKISKIANAEPTGDQISYSKEMSDRIADALSKLEQEQANPDNEELKKPYIADSSILFSSNEEYDTLSADQKEAMESFVLLVAPPYQGLQEDISLEKQFPQRKINRIAQEIKHNMANQVFNRLLAKKIALGETYPSEMKIMRENVKNVYFNLEKPKETIAFKIQTSQIATPSAVIRTYATLLSNRIHYSVKEYKESLYKEQIMAQLLLEEINN